MEWKMVDGDGSWEVEAGKMLETIKISEEEATIRRLMDSVFMKAAEAERLQRENEKLLADSKTLGKIIKIMEEWSYDPDITHWTLDEISAAIG